MAVKCKDRIRVGRLDIVELDSMVASGGKVAFVRRDAKAIDLRVRVGDCAGANAGERFPKSDIKLSVQIATNASFGLCEPDSVIVTSCFRS